MSQGQHTSFIRLFEQHPKVCIPILQRDYAQGRPTEAELRAAFLQALRDALDKPADDPSLPLDLDFVYGSVDNTGSFAPLDGQQRLTTLLLLHWYLAVLDDKLSEFTDWAMVGRSARFTYAVRPTSREFFNAILIWLPDLGAETKLSEQIADQSWFFMRWTADPTIQSALIMLDEIHLRFANTAGLYARLVDPDQPAVTFQLLELQHFGLSDDLYIKMNARGKPLTNFETFKARLVGHASEVVTELFELHGRPVSVGEYISHRIDTAWADLLWYYRDEQTALFDERCMKLIRTVVIVTRKPGENAEASLMRALRDNKEAFSFLRYYEAGCLDEAFIQAFVRLMDAWSGGTEGITTLLPEGGFFNESAFVIRLFTDATPLSYTDLVQFAAYCGYVSRHADLNPTAFGEWMRTVVNLSVNTPYDELDNYSRSVESLRELLKSAPNILEYLASLQENPVRFFHTQQIREERIKAALLLTEGGWRSLVEMAERHEYFAGQIEFLLDFSGVLEHWQDGTGFNWNSEQEALCLAAFENYMGKAFAVFQGAGVVKLPSFLWERALLMHGDYLLKSGRNHSFLHNAERDEGWKRLLRGGGVASKRALVKQVFDRIDLKQGVQRSLTKLLKRALPPESWRALLIQHPEAIEYCQKRNIRREADGRVYLLKRVRRNGEHAELLTYVLYLRLQALLEPGDDVSYYNVVSDEVEPFFEGTFACQKGRMPIYVEPAEGGVTVIVGGRHGALKPAGVNKIAELDWGDLEWEQGRRTLSVTLEFIDAVHILRLLTERSKALSL
jgi:hypothetical protein